MFKESGRKSRICVLEELVPDNFVDWSMLELKWHGNPLFSFCFLLLIFWLNYGFCDCKNALDSRTKQFSSSKSNLVSGLIATSLYLESDRVVSHATGSNNCNNNKKGTSPNGSFRFFKLENATQFSKCLDLCCAKAFCDLALLSGSRCFGLRCDKLQLCRNVLDKLRSKDQTWQAKTAVGAQPGISVSCKNYI